MPAPAQHLSPAELASLERAFASDPASDAYRALTEAYLAMGRFMEAMVVCKKGIKSHPSDASARVLLARVYATQGRDAKALEELRGALELAPRDVAALRMAGALQLKGGNREAGTASLRTAWEAAPDDPETLAVMKRFALSFGAPATQSSNGAPARARERVAVAAPVMAKGVAPGERSAPAAPAPEPAVGSAGAGPARAATAAAPQRPATRSPAADGAAYAAELAARYATEEHPLDDAAPRRRSRGRLVATAGLGVALAVVLAVLGITSSLRKSRAVEIEHLLRQAREQVEKDSYASYRDAARLCQRILDLDPDSLAGHAYLAYVDAIRWGELGDGEPARNDLDKQLAAVKRLGRGHSHAYAAQAYQRFYAGDASGAIDELKKVLAGPEGASALLHGVLGVIEMQSGDLNGARDALTYAHEHAPGDVRAAQMLAEQWRRRGQGYEPQASALYDAILTRLEPDHVPSLLGKARLLLDAGQPAEALKRVTRVLQLGNGAAPRQIALAHALRGAILQAQGKASDGEAEEQKALALDPSNAEVHDLIGRRKLSGGDVNGAIAAFEAAIQREPGRLGFYVDLASALMRRPGGARDAVATLRRASDTAGNARITKLLGDAYRAAGDLDGARSAYEKALAMEKRYPEARVALASLYRVRNDDSKALDELKRAIAEYGDGSAAGAAAAWIEIAEIEKARGSPAATVDGAYESALKADPQSCPALYWLGRSRGDRKMLSDYVRTCPKDSHVADAERFLGRGRQRHHRR